MGNDVDATVLKFSQPGSLLGKVSPESGAVFCNDDIEPTVTSIRKHSLIVRTVSGTTADSSV